MGMETWFQCSMVGLNRLFAWGIRQRETVRCCYVVRKWAVIPSETIGLAVVGLGLQGATLELLSMGRHACHVCGTRKGWQHA